MGTINTTGAYAVQNNKIIPASEVFFTEEGQVIYEVVRFEQGVPLFLEDHLARFGHSALKLGHNIQLDSAKIKLSLTELSRANGFCEGNIILKLHLGDPAQSSLWHFIPHTYPSPTDYDQGVAVGILYAERPNPEAKVLNLNVRQLANKLIEEHGYYEVLLADHEGKLTEGSRSNLFLIRNDRLYTAPSHKVLTGITMLKVLSICERLRVSVVRKAVAADELSLFDAAFLTGTSPKVLPIAKINDLTYNVETPLLKTLLKNYDDEVNLYIASCRNH